uniref:Aldehyde oxidase/xanthine dehydrogenase second molybdopterin binding domain-containing protein n=1 Tax=Dichotomosiphon tuberosus TaxID=118263 RepID=A0A386AWU0_9CHLO|nr:hypothetical protein [Dichotomosiphon tuberosus]
MFKIEGAFVQGMGWLCLEEVIYGDSKNNWIPYGQLYSCGPGLYKIPTVNDIPIDFRIKLLSNVPNTRTIHSSKAIGEPPLSLSNSVFFALKNAVAEARRQNGKSTMEWFDLEAPCTPEKLCLACGNLKQDDFCKILCSL